MGQRERNTPNQPERRTPGEIIVAQGNAFIGFVAKLLEDSIDAADNEMEANVMAKARLMLLKPAVQSAWLSKRFERGKDLKRLKPGEHPGIHYECHRADSSKVHINVKGGLREGIAPQDMRDTTASFALEAGQGNRTLGAIVAPTEVNINVINVNGIKDADIWVVTRLSGKEPTSVQKVEYLGVEAYPRILIPNTYADNAMDRFGIKAIIQQAIRAVGD